MKRILLFTFISLSAILVLMMGIEIAYATTYEQPNSPWFYSKHNNCKPNFDYDVNVNFPNPTSDGSFDGFDADFYYKKKDKTVFTQIETANDVDCGRVTAGIRNESGLAVDFKDSTVNVKNSIWDLNTYRVTASIENKPFVKKIKETQHSGHLDMTIDGVIDYNNSDCWGYVDYYER